MKSLHRVRHKFLKDCLGFFLFLLTYLAIILQIIGVYITPINDQSFQLIHNNIFYFTCFIAAISHIRASVEDPGVVTNSNNPSALWLYIKTNSKSIMISTELTRQLSKDLIKDKGNNSESSDDEDKTEYQENSAISDDIAQKIVLDYKVAIQRCKKCYVMKLPKTHHCSKCQGCVLRMDHHCPWINNCVGQFNQKFFILFCYYCFVGCLHSFFITIYYYMYKKQKLLFNRPLHLGIIVFQLAFAFFFVMFTGAMLWDQWDTICQDTTLIDRKQKKVVEKREIGEILEEVFSEPFGIGWFLPLKMGGNKYLLEEIQTKLETSIKDT